jgi:hypothetical protein
VRKEQVIVHFGFNYLAEKPGISFQVFLCAKLTVRSGLVVLKWQCFVEHIFKELLQALFK